MEPLISDHPDMTVTELDAHLTSLLDKYAPATKYIQEKKKENNASVYSGDSCSQKRTS